MASLPRVNDYTNELRVLVMNFAHDPMQDGLAGTIRRRRERALVHTSDTSQWASDSNELGSLILLQQWKHGLEKEQWSDSIDSDMLHDGVRVSFRYG